MNESFLLNSKPKIHISPPCNSYGTWKYCCRLLNQAHNGGNAHKSTV